MMKFTYDWLKDYCDSGMTPESLMKELSLRGVAVESVTKVGDDYSFLLEITANRPDLLSVVGVAREVALLSGKPLKTPSPSVKEEAGGMFPVEVKDKDLCPRYTARALYGVKVGASPSWLMRRVEAIGLRSVNNVVDITNYVMFETGQPLHAFDLDKLSGGRIVVRRASANEKIKAINGAELTLAPEMLVIADAVRPVALAGVMGGLDTEVSLSTKNVLLESACFDMVSVRRTSKKLSLPSDSSYRFERGVTRDQVDQGSLRAAAMIIELAGGAQRGPMSDCDSMDRKTSLISFRPARVRALLGLDVPEDTQRRLIESLGFKVVSAKAGVWELEAPHFRKDCTIEPDVIEEIARVNGYDKIPESPSLSLAIAAENRFDRVLSSVKQALCGAGYWEAMTNSFVREADQKPFDLWTADEPINVLEAQQPSDKFLRKALLPAILGVIKSNEDYREEEDARFFEMARIYLRNKGGGYAEKNVLCVCDRSGDLMALKGMVESILLSLGVSGLKFENRAFKCLADEDSMSCALPGGKALGVLGKVRKQVADKMELRSCPACAELDMDAIVDAAVPGRTFARFSRYPAIKRDLAFIMDRSVRWAEVESAVLGAGLACLEELRFFDAFEGGKIPQGKKNIAFSLSFRRSDRTMTAEEADVDIQKAVAVVTAKFGATLRTF